MNQVIRLATALFMPLFLSIALSAPVQADTSARTAIARAALPQGSAIDFGPAPVVVDAPLSKATQQALTELFGNLSNNRFDKKKIKALSTIADSGDARLAWLIADFMRFVTSRELSGELTQVANKLLGTRLRGLNQWGDLVDRLIAWDIPAPPNYLQYKRGIYTTVLPEWEPLFVAGAIDWRHVSWGGVRIDDRAFDKTDARCDCIPAADNPPVSDVNGAGWLKDDAIIFGVSLNGEHRAYPRQIMEVREMVNDTLGGRALGIPYCTLCGSAQAWFTDQLPAGVERPVLRTSGLLIRSNKVMYDLVTHSVFDTFLGTAVTGPLHEKGIKLKQASVVTTTWGDWKKAHPDTTVLVERLALGRDFDFRNGRDANGPIFPIGDVDPRLPVQEDILGVITPAGAPIAFHVASLITALDASETVEVDGVRVVLEAGGVRAVDVKGNDLGTHQAFWFAWSQFHAETKLWPDVQ